MGKVFFSFLCLCFLTVSLWAQASSQEVYRYIIPAAATEVAIVEESNYPYMNDKIKEWPYNYYDKYDFDMKELPPITKVIFYDKDGNKLDAAIKPPDIKHIQIDNKENIPVFKK